jgi:hypothetical protein
VLATTFVQAGRSERAEERVPWSLRQRLTAVLCAERQSGLASEKPRTAAWSRQAGLSVSSGQNATRPKKMMPVCGEWTLRQHSTRVALGKHWPRQVALPGGAFATETNESHA